MEDEKRHEFAFWFVACIGSGDNTACTIVDHSSLTSNLIVSGRTVVKNPDIIAGIALAIEALSTQRQYLGEAGPRRSLIQASHSHINIS